MRPQPKVRIVRRSMAYRLTHEPPDNPWTDVAVIAVSMVFLGIIALMASVLPAVP